ncbi:MAG: hypothetical protein ACRC35_14695, partial [Angustibacter sp.]
MTTCWRAMAGTAWQHLGGDVELLELLDTDDHQCDHDLLPSRLPALPAMLAATATSTLAASVLDGVRRGARPARAVVDVAHVALAARGERYAREPGRPASDLFAPLSRFWRTADGWVRMHATYPWHRRRALDVLGCPSAQGDDLEAVGRLITGWSSIELEDALAAAGAVGYAVREPWEWSAHPQGAAVAGLPLVTVDRRPHNTGWPRDTG